MTRRNVLYMPLKETPLAMLDRPFHSSSVFLAQEGLRLLPLIVGALTIPVDITAGAMDVEMNVGVGSLTVLVAVVECVVEDEVGTTILIVAVENVECGVDVAVVTGAFATAVDTVNAVAVAKPDTLALNVPFCASARLTNSCIWT